MSSPFVLSSEEAAAFIGVSLRTFHTLRAEPWFPKPVVLGDRTMRWVRAELEQALIQSAPRGDIKAEPEQLKASRRKP